MLEELVKRLQQVVTNVNNNKTELDDMTQRRNAAQIQYDNSIAEAQKVRRELDVELNNTVPINPSVTVRE